MIDLEAIKPLWGRDKVKIVKGGGGTIETTMPVDACYIYICAEPSVAKHRATVVLRVQETGEVFCAYSRSLPVLNWYDAAVAYSRAVQYVNEIRAKTTEQPKKEATETVQNAEFKDCAACEYCVSEYPGDPVNHPCEGCEDADFVNFRRIGFKR